MDTIVSGVGVIDKSFAILDALAGRPLTLGELVEATGINRATTHRIASALEQHDMVRRTPDGRFGLGYGLLALARQIDGLGPLVEMATPHLQTLASELGESAQLYVRDGDERVCVAVAESARGLRTIVEVGARLTLERGSAGAVLSERPGSERAGSERGAESTARSVVSVGEREEGVASVSAAVTDERGQVIAAISVSGPLERMGSDPGARFGPVVEREAAALSGRWQRPRP